jgi:hypothetical protein
MSLKATKVLLVFAFTGSMIAAARADDIGAAIKVCEATPSCSHSEVDAEGGVLFKVKRADGEVARLYCAADGDCARLYPRSKRVVVKETTSVGSLTGVLASR